MTLVIIMIVAVIVIVGIALIVSYNRFVKQRNLIQESWRQIDVELHRRYDLIPNLVETVRAFAAHERHVFEEVARLRTQAVERAGCLAGAAGRRRGAAVRRVAADDDLGRGLPAGPVEPELPQPAARADRHRGPDRGRPPVLQRERRRLQHPGRVVPVEPDRGRLQVREGRLLRGQGRAVRAVPQVSFGTIGSVAGEQPPPQMQQGHQSSGQIQPQMPGNEQGGYPQAPQQNQFPPAGQSPYSGQPPVGGPPAGAPGPQDGQPPFTGGQ